MEDEYSLDDRGDAVGAATELPKKPPALQDCHGLLDQAADLGALLLRRPHTLLEHLRGLEAHRLMLRPPRSGQTAAIRIPHNEDVAPPTPAVTPALQPQRDICRRAPGRQAQHLHKARHQWQASEEHAQQAGLARSVRPQHRQELAGTYGEAEIAPLGPVAEGKGCPAQTDDRCGGGNVRPGGGSWVRERRDCFRTVYGPSPAQGVLGARQCWRSSS